MKVGLALPAFELATGRALGLAEMAELAAEAEAAGFDSVWVMDHYWLENVPEKTAGHEPFAILAYLAARTERLTLGTLVACGAFRGAGLLARQASALADASGGRFVLGLGAGWQESEFDAFGHAFGRRVSDLEETLSVVPALLRGESVTHPGRAVRFEDASITTTAPAPPVWVAAFKPRMVSLAARFADGWNSSWHGPDPSLFVRHVATMRAALAEAGRAGQPFELSAGLWVLPVEGSELAVTIARAEALKPSSADATWPEPIEERMLTGSPDRIAAAIGAYADAGAGHVILNLSITPFSLFDRSYIEKTAPILRRLPWTKQQQMS